MMAVGVTFVLKRERGGVEGAALPVLGQVGAFSLTNQFGIQVRESDLEGYVWLADVVFSRCPGQCHQLSQMMSEIQRGLAPGLPIRFVSLTADPEFDSPAVLNRYAQRYGAEINRWLFLTGPKPEVYGLAMKGLKFSVVENEEAKDASIDELFIHSASFALVDRQGRLRAMVQAEDKDSTARILKLLEILAKEPWR